MGNNFKKVKIKKKLKFGQYSVLNSKRLKELARKTVLVQKVSKFFLK